MPISGLPPTFRPFPSSATSDSTGARSDEGNLRLGSTGDAVSALQQKLNGQEERLSLSVNGRFGPRTHEAVRRYQLVNGIQPANGVVGPATASLLSGPSRNTDTFEAASTAKRAPVSLQVPVSLLGAKKTAPIEQSHRVDGKKIYCTTAVTVDAPVDKALAATTGDWSAWWGHGRVTNLRHTPGGGTSFDLEPLAPKKGEGFIPGPIKVHVEMSAPKRTKTPDGREKVTMDVKISGDFEGPAHLDIERTKDGKTKVSSNWDGVTPTGWKGHFPEKVAEIHLAAEGGNIPGLSGGGFAGLGELLQAK